MSQQINLFNPVFRQQKKYFSSVTMVQSLGLVFLGCAFLVGDATLRLRQLETQVATTNATLLAKQEKLTQVKTQFPARGKSPALAGALREAQLEYAMLQAAAGTLIQGAYGEARGFSRFYQALGRQRIDGLWLTEVTLHDGGARIGVQGNVLQAAMVPQYMSRLASEPAMQGKSFSTLEIGQAARPVAGAGAAAPTSGYLQFSLQSSPSAAGPEKATP